MKVFELYTLFHLPDDFDGTFEDALRLLAAYSPDHAPKVVVPTSDDAREQLRKDRLIIELRDANWTNFVEGTQRAYKSVGCFALLHWDGGVWTKLPTKFDPVPTPKES